MWILSIVFQDARLHGLQVALLPACVSIIDRFHMFSLSFQISESDFGRQIQLGARDYILHIPMDSSYVLGSKKKVCTSFSAIFHCPLCFMSMYLVPKSRSEHVHYNRDFKL